MEQVVLIGDSIRMGYQPYVERELAGDASVWGPEENGGTSANVLSHLDEWVISRDPEVVHINTGLHDIRRPIGQPRNVVGRDEHVRNVREIVTLVREQTKARLIWALTTPVDEDRHNKVHGDMGDFQRYSEDVLTYNQAARDLLGSLEVETNDLFGVVVAAGVEGLLTEDGVHFTAQGYAMLGKAVADVIRG